VWLRAARSARRPRARARVVETALVIMTEFADPRAGEVQAALAKLA
jgi:hypothetical protein